MDSIKVYNPALTPVAGTYGVQLYSTFGCKNPLKKDVTFLRSDIIPSDCYNTYDSSFSLQKHIIWGDGIPPDDGLMAKFIGFVNDPESLGKFRLCVYQDLHCVGRPKPKIFGGVPGEGTEETFVDDVSCKMIQGVHGSFKVMDAKESCYVDNKTEEEYVIEEMRHRSPEEVLKRLKKLDWEKIPDKDKVLLQKEILEYEKMVSQSEDEHEQLENVLATMGMESGPDLAPEPDSMLGQDLMPAPGDTASIPGSSSSKDEGSSS